MSSELAVVDPFGLCSRAESKPEEEWARSWSRIKTLETEIEVLQELLAEDKKRLALICPHPEHHVEDKKIYVPSGYYDPSETTRWRECKVCGTQSEKITTTGSFG